MRILNCCGEHREQASTSGGPPHLPIFPATVGDVMFSHLRPVRSTVCVLKEIRVLLEQGGDTLIFETAFDQLV